MEAPEELSLGSKEHTNIVKGKRTKRVRPQSPIPFSITANSSTGEGEREDCYNRDDTTTNNNNNNNKKDYNDNDNNNNNSTPTTSSAGLHDSTDEEEDMANCLILLAQGQSRESPKQAEEDSSMNYTKYSSRKFLEAATLGSSRAGYYVYECKTCNKTFPSFQALGGHRASHKKPKNMAAMVIAQEKKQLLLSADEEEFQFIKTNKSLSLQLNSRGNLYTNNNKSKVHECSVCGAEFTSGQALGGHMRRHRAPVGTNTTLSLTPMALEPEEDQPRKRRNVLNLDLDLNLPAPEDDHQRESKFAFASKQQQQQQQQHGQQQQQHGQKQQQQQTNLVFSAPTLVDCHY
ncbi:zinc finger protein ZAT5-like [Gastrolobium bilobum]|uniref:zinc finger protein ZAT5-like n=1 Tax=Gastrolobium bilobum TaxID=150636 RepID=UPI002AB11559|nr:zinc finger protein ZAT5-like [Gastrolobium bilobum]